MRDRRQVAVTFRQLSTLLGIPKEVELVAVVPDDVTQSITLVVESEIFPRTVSNSPWSQGIEPFHMVLEQAQQLTPGRPSEFCTAW